MTRNGLGLLYSKRKMKIQKFRPLFIPATFLWLTSGSEAEDNGTGVNKSGPERLSTVRPPPRDWLKNGDCPKPPKPAELFPPLLFWLAAIFSSSKTRVTIRTRLVINHSSNQSWTFGARGIVEYRGLGMDSGHVNIIPWLYLLPNFLS